MNSNPANKKTLQWEVDRYLLADPSFDRAAFEQRMLEDLALAELVAASVTNLQAISSAAKANAVKHFRQAKVAGSVRNRLLDAACARPVSHETSYPSQVTSERSTSSYAYRWAMLVSAAAVLMAISAWQFGNSPNDDQLAQIADNWVAIEGLSTAESLELIATEEQANESPADLEANEQTDWIVEAAREFYLAKNEGAAG